MCWCVGFYGLCVFVCTRVILQCTTVNSLVTTLYDWTYDFIDGFWRWKLWKLFNHDFNVPSKKKLEYQMLT